MERAWSSRLHKVLAFGLWFLGLLTIAAHADELAKSDRLTPTDGRESIVAKAAELQPVEDVSMAETAALAFLQLETFINGVTTGLIGSFRLNDDGTLSVAPDELRELGLVPDPAALAADGMIDLSRLPHVAYEYDEAAQVIRFSTGDQQRIARKLGIENGKGDLVEVERGFGALVNYTLTASFETEDYFRLPDYSGVFGYFDGRLFSAYGTLESSFTARSAPEDGEYLTRLDTAWRYSDPQSLRTYIAGDFISSGLAWTRPIRMGVCRCAAISRSGPIS